MAPSTRSCNSSHCECGRAGLRPVRHAGSPVRARPKQNATNITLLPGMLSEPPSSRPARQIRSGLGADSRRGAPRDLPLARGRGRAQIWRGSSRRDCRVRQSVLGLRLIKRAPRSDRISAGISSSSGAGHARGLEKFRRHSPPARRRGVASYVFRDVIKTPHACCCAQRSVEERRGRSCGQTNPRTGAPGPTGLVCRRSFRS